MDFGGRLLPCQRLGKRNLSRYMKVIPPPPPTRKKRKEKKAIADFQRHVIQNRST